MSEKNRREPRNPCYLRAELFVAPNAAPIVAEVHDISAHGMRLVVLNARTLPERFVVSVPRRHMRETVRVARRADNEVGVVIQRA